MITTRDLSSNESHLKIRRTWYDIKSRCYNPKNKFYIDYGSRGIILADEWLENVVAFSNYVISLPNFSKASSIDRIDNNSGYLPGNIRWASSAEQVRNRRRNKNNTSGCCGVTWYYNVTGGTRSVAWWQPLGAKNAKSKSFSVKTFGLLPAFALAVEYRRKMIQQLNFAGAGYSSQHGLEV